MSASTGELASGVSHWPSIKSEPVEHTIREPLFPMVDSKVGILLMAEDAYTTQADGPLNLDPSLKIYRDAAAILYTPETALEQGLAMVRTAKAAVSALEAGSAMRQKIWNREFARLENPIMQKTVIALCGATGAGKSSVINALLQANIVPTSGMRACTATVTEISYHDQSTIDAEIEFLSSEEWKAELHVLLQDIQDDDGQVKQISDMRGESGIAWHKVHTLYPTITTEEMISMTVDQIIDIDPKIKAALDSTKHLRCRDTKEFGKQIKPYIESKDQRRAAKKDKNKDKDKSVASEPAFWPLIRCIKIKCNAEALSCGAVLCDLPGCADANAARNNVAKEYLKLANCIWILAPIHRAVDDKIARDLLGVAFKTQLMMDGNYDESTVTFIATKADDVAATEIITALSLEDEPELQDMEATIKSLIKEIKGTKAHKMKLGNDIKMMGKLIDNRKSMLAEFKEHLRCLQTGQKFVPRFKKGDSRGRTDGKRAKRRRLTKEDSDDDQSDESTDKNQYNVPATSSEGEADDMDSQYDEDDAPQHEYGSSRGGSLSSNTWQSGDFSDDSSELSSLESLDSQKPSNSRYQSETESLEVSEDEAESETQASLKDKVKSIEIEIKRLRSKLSELQGQKSHAGKEILKNKKRLPQHQRKKNAFCALKRAEYSREVLKQGFREGLRDIDETDSLYYNGSSHDSQTAVRDYTSVNLPVFCVSARDFAGIHRMNSGDGEPTTFSEDTDTEIPALLNWCKSLATASRRRAAKSFMEAIQAFTTSILPYLDGPDKISRPEREVLRRKWQTLQPQGTVTEQSNTDTYAWIKVPQHISSCMALSANPQSSSVVERNRMGITSRLCSDFKILINGVVGRLSQRILIELKNQCDLGATQAAEDALEISDKFADSMHWQTYRATLRRSGEFRQDLNAALCDPLQKYVAKSWAQAFDADLVFSLENVALSIIKNMANDVETSTHTDEMRRKCNIQGVIAQEESKVELKRILEFIANDLQDRQKEISRLISPTIRSLLCDGYFAASQERGRGSVARQKLTFRDQVDAVRGSIFKDVIEKVSERLESLTDGTNGHLKAGFEGLAQKFEVSMAVLWDDATDTPLQRIIRQQAKQHISMIIDQIGLWNTAESKQYHVPTQL
ncbi:hypothetical protein CPB86DRAFT_786050 [Serendipita vermifera]|nr:hypothetical protein CPB86DRAFT_786050 [Serendipita vermifera]